MSNAGKFSSKHALEEKKPRFFEDFRSKQLRLDDGTRESKHIAKVDVAADQSKFYKPTTVSTLVEKTLQGEKETSKDTMGEKETTSQVRKPIDVNRRQFRP